MKKRYYLWSAFFVTVSVLIFLFLSTGCSNKKSTKINKEKKEQFSKIKNHIQLIDRDTINYLSSYQKKSLIWPSQENIEKDFAKADENKNLETSKIETIKWIKKLLKDEKIHPDINDLLIPLNSHIRETDYFRVRWEVDDFYIQIIIYNRSINFLFKQKDKKYEFISKVDKIKFVKKTIKRFFKHSDRVINESITDEKLIMEGDKFIQLWTFPINEYAGGWQTDGKILIITFLRVRAGPRPYPLLIKDWFSDRKIQVFSATQE